MYKAGRRWLVAAAAVAAIGLGVELSQGQNVAAAETPVSETSQSDSESGTTTSLATNTQTPAATPNTTAIAASDAGDTPQSADATQAPTTPATTTTPQVKTQKSAASTVAAQPAIAQTDNDGNVTAAKDKSNGATTQGSNLTTNAWLSATNNDGTETTTSNNADQGKNVMLTNAKNVQLHYQITNPTDQAITQASIQLVLPPTGQNAAIGKADGLTYTIDTSIADIDAQITQNTGDSAWYTDVNGNPDNDWTDAEGFEAKNLQTLTKIFYSIPSIAAKTTLNLVIDLTINNADTAATGASNVSQFGIQDTSANQVYDTVYYSVFTAPFTQPVTTGFGAITTTIGSTDNQAITHLSNDPAVPGYTDTANTMVNYSEKNSLYGSFTIGNETAGVISIHPQFLMPLLNGYGKSKWLLDDSKITLATFTDALPDTVEIKFSPEGKQGSYFTYDEIMAQYPDFTWSQLLAVQIDGPIAGGTSYTVNLPMVYTGSMSDLGTDADTAELGVWNYNMSNWSANYTVSTASLVYLTYGAATSTRTINFVNADGTPAPQSVVQTMHYKTTTNSYDGTTLYTPQDAYYQYTVPTQVGYTPDVKTVAQQTVKPGYATAADSVVTVTYTPNMTYGTATSTRTIHFVDAQGHELKAPEVQTIAYKTVTNAVTGETIYTPQGAYYQFQTPSITGYTTTQASVDQLALGASNTAPENLDVNVLYTKNPTLPITGSGQTKPTTKPEGQPSTNPQAKPTSLSHVTATTKAAGITGNTGAAAHTLPNTGDSTSVTLMMLGSTLIALLGVAGYRKQH